MKIPEAIKGLGLMVLFIFILAALGELLDRIFPVNKVKKEAILKQPKEGYTKFITLEKTAILDSLMSEYLASDSGRKIIDSLKEADEPDDVKQKEIDDERDEQQEEDNRP